MTNIINRPFKQNSDINAITRFLLDTYKLNGTLHNWDPRRWQGQIFHRDDQDYADYIVKLPRLVHIWEDTAENISGVVLPEYDGGVFVQIHPDYRWLEGAMLEWAEKNLMQVNEDDQQWLHVWAFEDDKYRADLLKKRGYQQTDGHEILRRRSMRLPISEISIPDGYRIRSMRQHPDDLQGQADLLNAAFNRSFHKADDYKNFQLSPFYDTEFDIVVEAADGLLVANAGFMVHPDESFAMLEPVCTHPDHHSKGLATIAIIEGLKRIQRLNLEAVYVSAWYSNPVANHLYEKSGFSDPKRQYLWTYMNGK